MLPRLPEKARKWRVRPGLGECHPGRIRPHLLRDADGFVADRSVRAIVG